MGLRALMKGTTAVPEVGLRRMTMLVRTPGGGMMPSATPETNVQRMVLGVLARLVDRAEGRGDD